MALLLAGPAMAQTTLRLNETGEARRLPDELMATLRAEARAPTAAAAQAAVNRMVAAALARAGQVAAVTATTGRYATHRIDTNRTGEPRETPAWQASQEVTLRSDDTTAALAVLGALQEGGLAVGRIGWRLKPDTEAAMREEATHRALDAVQARVAAVAAQLRLTVERLAVIELDRTDAPLGRAMAVSAAREAPLPMAVPEESVVTVRATAEVVLRQP